MRPLASSFVYITIIILFLSIFSCGKKIHLESYLKNNLTWSMYGQYSQRKFFIEDTLHLPLKYDFKTQIKAGLNYSSVTAMDGFLFIGDLKGNVYKIDLNTGRIQSFNNFKQPIFTSIVVNTNSLIIPIAEFKERNSYLIIYDLVRGEEKTRIAVNGSIEKEILFVNNNIFLTTTNGSVYKLNPDYSFDWKISLKSQIYSHPAAGDDFLVTATIDGTVYIISFNGKIIKEIKLNNKIKSGFCVEGSKIYFGDDGGFIYCYEKNQGKFLISKKLAASISVIPSIDNENIFVGDLGGNVFSISKKTGEIIWRKNLGGLINNSILIIGDKLVVPNYQKKIFVLEKFNGKVLQEMEFEGRIKLSPIYIKNKLILGHDEKKIIALTN